MIFLYYKTNNKNKQQNNKNNPQTGKGRDSARDGNIA